MTFKEAEESDPELIALHRTIETYYRELLKRHKKDKTEHQLKIGDPSAEGGQKDVDRRRKVSVLMPENIAELKSKIGVRQENKDDMALVRRGRIIHYQVASGANTDSVSEIANSARWNDVLSEPYFWTTEGQIEIKRAESFVRVWRNFVAHGSRTLTDWINPILDVDDNDGDVTTLFPNNLQPLSVNAVERTNVLFGARAALLGEGDDLLETVRVLGTIFADIRHNTFHFRGAHGFIRPLTRQVEHCDQGALSRLRQLYDEDKKVAHHRVREELRAAHVEHFMDQARLEHLWINVQGEKGSETKGGRPTSPVTLPRFTRVIKRNANAWGNRNANLPGPVNKDEMKKPEKHFHYIVSKLLYSRGFRQWISRAEAKDINNWIKTASNRAQKATEELNGKDEAHVAKMVGLIEVPEGMNIRRFFDDLVGLTATEFRVQKGYESDGEAAQKQAAFLENLNCDVMALAFNDYLVETKFEWLARLARPENHHNAAISSVDKLLAGASDFDNDDWEVVLYGVLHLVPVGEVAKLQHQLRRWANKPGSKDVEVPLQSRMEDLFTLYLDCHDEKFEGGGGLQDSPYLSELFGGSNAGLVRDKILPTLGSAQNSGLHERVPLRQLREMLRFGNLRAIRPFCVNVPITWEMYQRLEQLEKGESGSRSVADAQVEKAKQHDLLTKAKKDGGGSVDTYVSALRVVVEHRRVSNHVNMINHVRFNELMMTLLGRLADISGIWERDLYFVSLALIEQHGKTPADIFKRAGLQFLSKGRIIAALRKFRTDEPCAKIIKDRLDEIFGWKGDIGVQNRTIRNRFAHFLMFEMNEASQQTAFDLTSLLNEARSLLSYDRKMKNAVVSSINTILERSNVEVHWEMKEHKLDNPFVKSKGIRHLKDRKVGTGEAPNRLNENLCDELFLEMVASLVKGRVAAPIPDVVSSA